MKTLCLLALSLVLSSCAGYHLGGQKPAHLANITKLAVPTFENQTLEPRLSSVVTNSLIKQIQMDGSYQIVRKEDADAVLEGVISRVDRSQFRSVRRNVLRTSQLQMRLVVSYAVKDAASGRAIHVGGTSGMSYVILDSNVQNSEAQALDDAAQRVATTIANEISEGW
ncbi:LPS assembly lipoprotein LptE [Brevifollis gellanilyticus]|uniref:Lipoprotein n=1 Tax=Brevifollis gellanilyticus TaxID=748831 RepID=A0A512MAS5_9BACT|nr:LptE family protein [Brevifollis gellanilyticus]GEP43830.1 hypothetical protein BGE01nite_31210 [Brevifollis gellanilyticus]